MPNTDLTLENIKLETETSLGVSGVDVELADADIKKCLKDALRIYNRNRPDHIKRALSVTTSQKKYRIDDLIPNLLGVIDVDFLRQRNVFGDPFDPFFNDRTGLTVTGDTYGEFDQKLHYIEQARRVGSNEPEWHPQWEDVNGKRQFFLYIDAPIPVDTHFTATAKFTPDDASMQRIPEGDVDWILGFTLARAKKILSKIRGKFKGITGPEGATTEIDYDDLKEEGTTEETELMEEIRKRRRPLLPVLE